MKQTYKAMGVSTPDDLHLLERPILEPGTVRFGFGWKHAESVTAMRPRLWARTRVWFFHAFLGMK